MKEQQHPQLVDFGECVHCTNIAILECDLLHGTMYGPTKFRPTWNIKRVRGVRSSLRPSPILSWKISKYGSASWYYAPSNKSWRVRDSGQTNGQIDVWNDNTHWHWWQPWVTSKLVCSEQFRIDKNKTEKLRTDKKCRNASRAMSICRSQGNEPVLSKKGNLFISVPVLSLCSDITERKLAQWKVVCPGISLQYIPNNINGLVPEICNSSAIAMELRLSCTNPLICIGWVCFVLFCCVFIF